MIITDTLRKEMERDIERCENCNNNSDSGALYNDIVSRYCYYDKRFANILAPSYFCPDNLAKVSFISECFRKMVIEAERKKLEQAASWQEEKENPPQQQKTDAPIAATGTGKPRVFIVHGHDDAAKLEVARMLEHAGFEPIILHEQANSGETIIEKIEKHTDVCFAVVLYTPCDLGRAKEDAQEQPRARQNVVLEHGYLMAKLGRERVCALVKDGVERPGDIDGVVYIPMDGHGGWKLQLATEMKAVGLDFDLNTL